jgi:hypothetical protein
MRFGSRDFKIRIAVHFMSFSKPLYNNSEYSDAKRQMTKWLLMKGADDRAQKMDDVILTDIVACLI